jgi:predicted  nucleic acid-binding Zn-ribbon protein
MPVEELLNNLEELQAVDKEIFDFRRQLKEIPARLKALDGEIEVLNSNLKQKEEELKALQIKHKEKEIDLGQKEGNIKKLQVQLYQIKTNKEYTAMEKEIAGSQADKSLLEEEIIFILDEIEEGAKAIDEKKKHSAEEKQRIDADKKRIDSEKQEIEKRLSELGEKRKTIIPLIDRDTLSRYERILQGKDGLALVPVVGENCGGCYVNLPPQIINEIRLKERIMYCERCARMLYIDD